MNSKRILSSHDTASDIYSNRRQSVPAVIQESHLIHRTSPSGKRNMTYMDVPENQPQPLYQPYGKITFGGGSFNIMDSNTLKNKEKEDVQELLKAKQDLLRKNGFKPRMWEPDPQVAIKSFEVLVGGIKQIPQQEQKLTDRDVVLNKMLPVQQEKTNFSPSARTINSNDSPTYRSNKNLGGSQPGNTGNKIDVQDIFQLMEHNQVIAKRMQDLQRIIADQKRNIDELPHIHEKNCAQQNHSHRQHQPTKVPVQKKMSANPIKQHSRAKSKMEIYGSSLQHTGRNEHSKRRNDQIAQDYSDQMILEQSREAKLKQIAELKKKKVHRLTNRSESRMNEKQSQKKLSDLFKQSPFKNRFQESKLLQQDAKMQTLYQPHSHHQHQHGATKCNFHLTSVNQDKEKTWQEKTFQNLNKLQMGGLGKQKDEVVNSFNFMLSDLQLVKLV